VYFLYSLPPTAGKYYIGSTCDHMLQRLQKHNTNHTGFTGKKGDWVIVYTETFDEKAKAYKREREVKAWKSRKKIEQLIGSVHPDL
jgi:putative endonuclease